MLSTWLPRFLVTIAIALSFTLFRRMAPPHARMAGHRYDESQVPRTAPDRGHRRCNVERRDRTGYVLFRS